MNLPSLPRIPHTERFKPNGICTAVFSGPSGDFARLVTPSGERFANWTSGAAVRVLEQGRWLAGEVAVRTEETA